MDSASLRRIHRRGWTVTVVAAVAALGMVATACGGGGKKATTSTSLGTTSTTGVETTETSAQSAAGAEATTSTLASGITTTSIATGRTTATTAKKTSKTTVIQANKPVTGGISNVTSPPNTAPLQQVQPGGTITFLKGAEIASLDPIALPNSGTNDGPPAAAVFDLLVYSDPTDGLVKPQTANSLTSTDALVWTLKLRPNIKFTDGTPYDATAVKFNWR